MYQSVISDIKTLATVPYYKRRSLIYSFIFFTAMLAVSSIKPDLLPVVIAGTLILPLRFLLYYGGKLGRDAYFERFPVLANLTNYRLVTLLGILSLLPVMYAVQGSIFVWSEFGTVSFLIGAVSIGVMTWSKSLYARNFYYDQWHLDLRFLVLLFGILSVITPVFIPIFLAVHHLSTEQFDRLSIKGRSPRLGETHDALPLTMLLVLSAFGIVGLVFNIEPFMMVFLLLCGYAAHYVFSGFAKLRFGVRYYITQNNPFFISMNAYQSGWLRGIPEETVARLGQYTNRIKPALNLYVILVEVGAIAILFSYHIAVAIGCLTFLLHLTIFLLSGDNFWQWMSVDAALVTSLLTAPASTTVLFSDTSWFLVSLPFIGFAIIWMKPKKLGWLDSPYYESYRIEAEFEDRSPIHLNTRVFKPLEEVIRQGFSGHFTYLGSNPRTTHNWGDVTDIETHRYLYDLYPEQPDPKQKKYLVDELGTEMYDEGRTEEFKEFLEEFATQQTLGEESSLLRYLTPPREQYHRGFPSSEVDGIPETEPERLRVYRIDGIWTETEFHKTSREELFSVPISAQEGA